MNRIDRRVSAFAQRAKMVTAESTFFAIVEGRESDRVFYDRLLRGILGDEFRLTIYLAEQLKTKDKMAGGKPAAYKILDELGALGPLRFDNAGTKVVICLFLDRDLEHLAGTARLTPHVIYSESRDVEAEILNNGDLVRAISSTYSLDTDLARAIVEETSTDILGRLAELWRVWIALSVAASQFGVHGSTRFSQRSTINRNIFGQLDTDLASKLIDEIAGAVGIPSDELLEACERHLHPIYESGRHRLLSSGKWADAFVRHVISQRLSDIPLAQVANGTLVKCCIETVDFSAPWSAHYRRRVLELIAQ